MWNDKITARNKQAFRPVVEWICIASKIRIPDYDRIVQLLKSRKKSYFKD